MIIPIQLAGRLPCGKYKNFPLDTDHLGGRRFVSNFENCRLKRTSLWAGKLKIENSVVHKIDATNKILGRLASEIALILRGKNSPKFDPAKLSGTRVVVYNTDRLAFTGKKMNQKLYRRHSGFIGKLKEEKLKDLMGRDSRLVLKHAVMGMLPKNKLRNRIIKNLVIFKGEK